MPTRKNNRDIDNNSLKALRKEIITLVSENKWYEAHNKLSMLVLSLSQESGRDKKKLPNLRRSLSQFLDRVAGYILPGDSDSKNFRIIVMFLRSKFTKTRRRKAIALSTIATYLEQLKKPMAFAHSMKEEFDNLDGLDLRTFKEGNASSLRILKEVITWSSTMQGVDSKIDMEDPSLLVKKSCDVVEFIELELSLSNLDKLSVNETLSLLLAYDLFLRLSEIAQLKTDDIILKLYPGINVIGKGSKQRFVPLIHFPRVFDIFKKVLPHISSDYLISKSNGQPYSKAGIRKIIKRALKKLNMPATHVHFLRHLGINKMLMKGDTLKIVSSIAGHAQPETTITSYLHVQGILVNKIIATKKEFISSLLNIKPKLVSTEEASNILRRGRRTVQLLAKNGMLRAQKKAGEWFFEECDLMEYRFRQAEICCL